MLATHFATKRAYCRVGNSSVRAITAKEQKLTWPSPHCLDVSVNRLSGLISQLEPDRLSGLLLTHCRAIDSLSVRSNILDLEVYDIAAA